MTHRTLAIPHRRTNPRLATLACGLASLLLLTACDPAQRIDTTQEPPPYDALAARHNAHVAHLDRVWARASVRVFFRTEAGKWKTETGEDSTLMLRPPSDAALALGKLGKTAFWAGCNQELYWLFDTYDTHTVWYGRNDPEGPQFEGDAAFPLPIHPAQFFDLLGLSPLPVGSLPAPVVSWDGDLYRVDLPGQNRTVWLDPRTALARRVELRDAQGQPRVRAELTGDTRVELGNKPRPQWPRIADRVEAQILGEEATLTLWIKDATDAAGDAKKSRALETAFDFPRLLSALRPQRAINLDERRE